jgi:hypothetical protein
LDLDRLLSVAKVAAEAAAEAVVEEQMAPMKH